jgi:hypothetical protein
MFYKNLTNALHMCIQQILFLLSKFHFKQNILNENET